MITIEQGFSILRDAIENKTRHKNYTRVCDKADEYKMFYTGEGVPKKIKNIYEIDVVPKLVFSIIPPILKSTKYPFNKVCRTKPSVRKIDFEGESTKEKEQEVEKAMGKYFNGFDIDRFFESVVVPLNYTDPNAWIVTEFKPFDNINEKAKPYPAIFSSKEAINFEYENSELNFLLILQGQGDDQRYTMYLGQYTLVSFIRPKDYVLSGNENIFTVGNKEYVLQVFEPKSGFVPAVRVGYKMDTETNMQTYLGVFDDILPFLYKLLKLDYETDICFAEMAFPKRYMYAQKCKHEGCRSGRMPNGETCPVCHGSGVDSDLKTALEVRTFALPNDKEEMIDLSKMMFKDLPPVAQLEFMERIRNSWKDGIFGMLFNSDTYDKTQISSTATAVNATTDNLNDAIYPFAQKLSDLFIEIGRSVATFLDYPDVIIYHIYPRDFKFKSIQQLFGDLQAARSANASPQTIAAIESEINEQQYMDAPEVMKIIRIRQMFNPFAGLSENTVRAIIAARQTTEYNAVLWSNIVPIFQELEMEWNGNQTDWLYDLPIAQIKELISVKVNEYIAALPKAAEPTSFSFNSDGN